MPGMDIADSGRSVSLNDRQLFKAHRPLPRKRDFVPDPPPPNVQVQDLDRVPDSLSNGIVHPGPPGLPLTPPSLPAESRADNSLSTLQDAQKEHALDDAASATLTTPHADPLTPDVTPPRTLALRRKHEEQNNQLQPSMSSRAESFTTAREALSSDDEPENRRKSNTANSSSLQTSRQRSPHPLRNGSRADDNYTFSGADGSHDPPQKLQAERADPRYFDSFDGQWNGHQQSSQDESVLVNPKSRANKLPVTSSSRQDGRVRQKRHTTQDADTKPTIQKFAADIGWLDSVDQMNGDAKSQSWRLSGTSTTSTVEAMVIDSPPQKRRTLRHTGKAESLRTASSPARQQHRHVKSSSASIETERRLSHKPARLSNEDRRSIASDKSLTNNSATSDRRRPKEEVIPVVVIPQRRSSLRASAQNSANHSRSQSMHSARRPTTAPDGGTGVFDVPRKRRTMSESSPHAPIDFKSAGHRGTAAGPKIPPRRSSLSAPTSANNSRAPSITSNAPNRQSSADTDANAAPPSQPETRKMPEPSQVTEPPVRSHENQPPPPVVHVVAQDISDSSRAPQDDIVRFQSPLAPPLTPFQTSIKSISPGPVEISEARAVPFFAHNNESILVVERYHPQAGARLLEGSNTIPTSKQEPQDVRAQDSSFRAQDSSSHEPTTNSSTSPSKPPVSAGGEYNGDIAPTTTQDSGVPVSRLSSLRRALRGARRQPEALTATLPAHRVRNPKAGKDMDSNKQAFWRPRAFWDDVKEPDSDGKNNPPYPAARDTNEEQRGDDNTFIGNSLGIPQSKAIFQGPLSLIRRVSNRARLRSARQPNLSHVSLASSMLSRRSRRNRLHFIPGFGLLSLKDTQRWLNRIRRRREEERLEARRGKLKKKIGAKVPVNDHDPLLFPSGTRQV